MLDPFDLSDDHAAKSADDLIAADRAHLRRLGAALSREQDALTARLALVRRQAADAGVTAVDRDLETRRLSATLRLRERYGIDMCLGRMTPAAGPPVYIGRAGVSDADGTRLLVDWRAPAAEPYFAATWEDPRGLLSRRRYRWNRRRITDYWDEALSPEGLDGAASLDDQSAFLASLDAHRTGRMRDVLATIQADQDAIVRAPSPGALVVDGGPGTGKTVVALHRAAHLLYAEPRLTTGAGGMLLVGPNPQYLGYVEDVLPSLGEDTVRLCTLRDLTPEGAGAIAETDSRVAELKQRLDPELVIAAAVSELTRPPMHALRIEAPWADLWVSREDWADLFARADPASPHNEARDEVWEEVLETLVDQVDDPEVPESSVRRWLRQDDDLTTTFVRAWPLLSPAAVVATLWASPALLSQCAPDLPAEELALLHRAEGAPWTDADLPLLDAAHRRLGDPEAVREQHRRQVAAATAREQMSAVVDHLVESDDSEMKVMSILRGADARTVLAGADVPPPLPPDELAGPFGHIVVDEAQELTDAQWRTLIARCPSRSFTVVGDRAQARRAFTESWSERLHRLGLRNVRVSSLRVNYRTPTEVMAVAAPTILEALPDANVPVSVRESGIPVRHGNAVERDEVIEAWLAANPEGIAAVIGDPTFAPNPRVRALTPEEAKGLEFDLVVLVRPEGFGSGRTGAVDRYVAMTRTTRELVILR
ncbi:RNA polymerase recycling motor ATPase HelR [uncultured Microbacterium sp.]|uniref:RNA polymerase recycling motor ATPase HelR n=1 Tax=uncultured Microbacterium sp. TaxID=191216 RepID=UPI0028EE88AB|nr:RNA polymerase recycling motor ATPase HelR [uncultured Microbacterium sp.]